ncbi:MAG: tetratricopeptide repeat protein [Candidatus Korobacteraceae bacterium]|jgi:Tfp pilus assembly protein PilF
MGDFNEAKIPNQRLDSWKEIAAFFRRDERTVKRWEKERGLPVHRLQGSATGRVYAYSDELLRWMKSPVSAEPVASTVEPAEADHDTSAVGVPQAATLTLAVPAQGEVNLRRRASDQVRPARWGRLFGALVLAVLLVVTGGFLYLKRVVLRSGRPDASAGKSLAAGHTTNPEARDFYLKGRYEWDKRTPESLNKAVDYFTQAIVHDPNYAQAYVGLADCYNLLREYSAMPPEEAYPRALAAAKKAVELDDSSAEAHTSLAFATFYGSFDAAGAEREFRRALALNPNDARAHHWYATSLYAEGRYAEALSQVEMAQQLDPASTAILADKGLILLYAGPREQGVALLKQLESTEPEFLSTYRYLQDAALMDKDYPAYLETRAKAARLRHDPRELAIINAEEKGFARGQRQGMFESLLEEQQKLYAEGHLSAYDLAATYGFLGNKAKALEYLQRAYAHHELGLTSIRNNLAFEDLHGDPTFRKLVVQVGLPPLP